MSSSRQGFLRNIEVPAAVFRRAMNVWPPFLGAAVRVVRVSSDFREIDVEMKLRLFNRNYVGTHFGGSLYAMTDPFFALMMMRNLGPEYVVWDKAGAIRYVKPGRGAVFAHFRMPQQAIEKAQRATTRGRKYEPTFTVPVCDAKGDIVAEVEKTLYIRHRPHVPARADATPRRTRAAA